MKYTRVIPTAYEQRVVISDQRAVLQHRQVDEDHYYADVGHRQADGDHYYADVEQGPIVVNDHHSQLNETIIASVCKPRTEADLVRIVSEARSTQQFSIAGGRHAMGGQQFLTNATLIDMTDMNALLQFDDENGLVKVESGIM